MTCWKMYLWSFEYMKIIYENCRVKNYMKEDHRSYRHNLCTTVAKRKAWKNSGFFRLFSSQLQKLIFAIRTDLTFSCWELIFVIFRKYPVPSIQHWYIFSNNTTVCIPYVKSVFVSLYTALFLNERDKLQLNRHDFLLLYFCIANLRERIFTLE